MKTTHLTGSTGEGISADYAFDNMGWLFHRLAELGLRKSENSKKFSFEYIQESLKRAFEAGAKHASETKATYRALKVLTLTSRIVDHLKAVDPQAYKQALRAIAEAEGQTT